MLLRLVGLLWFAEAVGSIVAMMDNRLRSGEVDFMEHRLRGQHQRRRKFTKLLARSKDNGVEAHAPNKDEGGTRTLKRT